MSDAQPSPIRILITELEDPTRTGVAELLEMMERSFERTSSAVQAVDLVSRNAYDLIILDFTMEEMDGLKVAEQVRIRENKDRRAFIVALTGAGEADRPEQQTDSNIDQWLSKPLSIVVIERLLDIASNGIELEPPGGRAESAPQAPEQAPPPVKLRFIQDVSDGDKDFERELVDLFFAHMDEHIMALESLIEEHDLEGVKFEAHSIKGASANIGADRMQELAMRIEAMGAEDKMETAAEALAELKRRFEQVRRFLEGYVDSP